MGCGDDSTKDDSNNGANNGATNNGLNNGTTGSNNGTTGSNNGTTSSNNGTNTETPAGVPLVTPAMETMNPGFGGTLKYVSLCQGSGFDDVGTFFFYRLEMGGASGCIGGATMLTWYYNPNDETIFLEAGDYQLDIDDLEFTTAPVEIISSSVGTVMDGGTDNPDQVTEIIASTETTVVITNWSITFTVDADTLNVSAFEYRE